MNCRSVWDSHSSVLPVQEWRQNLCSAAHRISRVAIPLAGCVYGHSYTRETPFLADQGLTHLHLEKLF